MYSAPFALYKLTIFSNMTDVKDVKPAEEDKEETQRKIQAEYLKAYYAAFLRRQQEVEQAATDPEADLVQTPDEEEKEEVREVGVKAKREEEEEEDEVEWEDAGATEDNGPTIASQDSLTNDGGAIDSASGGDFEEEHEDVDWEEG